MYFDLKVSYSVKWSAALRYFKLYSESSRWTIALYRYVIYILHYYTSIWIVQSQRYFPTT